MTDLPRAGVACGCWRELHGDHWHLDPRLATFTLGSWLGTVYGELRLRRIDDVLAVQQLRAPARNGQAVGGVQSP